MQSLLPEVLIVGRPNVGKSTLFNRLAGKSLALVDNQAGSTRDLKSFELLWNGVSFTMTDSGGWVPGEKESIAFKVGEKLDARIKKVSALLFVVDGLEGATPADNLLSRSISESTESPLGWWSTRPTRWRNKKRRWPTLWPLVLRSATPFHPSTELGLGNCWIRWWGDWQGLLQAHG